MRWMSPLFIALLLAATSGCATQYVSLAEGPREYVATDYETILRKWTRTGDLFAVSELESYLTVTATFEPITHGVAVTVVGQGGVGSAPAGISCPGSCSAAFAQGSTLTLAATPVAGQRFAGWSGAGCSGTAGCTVGVSAAASVTATFEPITQGLTVVLAGSGTGTVTGTGINCGADCSEALAQGSVVVLTATPAAGQLFSGWSGGGCTGTGSCTVTLNAATTVTATFAPITHVLTVVASGSGSVSGTGINCGADCSETVSQ